MVFKFADKSNDYFLGISLLDIWEGELPPLIEELSEFLQFKYVLDTYLNQYINFPHYKGINIEDILLKIKYNLYK